MNRDTFHPKLGGAHPLVDSFLMSRMTLNFRENWG